MSTLWPGICPPCVAAIAIVALTPSTTPRADHSCCVSWQCTRSANRRSPPSRSQLALYSKATTGHRSCQYDHNERRENGRQRDPVHDRLSLLAVFACHIHLLTNACARRRALSKLRVWKAMPAFVAAVVGVLVSQPQFPGSFWLV